MNEADRAAFINSKVACALIAMNGMIATNMQRQSLGQSMAYDEKAFSDLEAQYDIGYNSVLGLIQGRYGWN